MAEKSSVDIAQQSDRRSSACTTSMEDLGFSMPKSSSNRREQISGSEKPPFGKAILKIMNEDGGNSFIEGFSEQGTPSTWPITSLIEGGVAGEPQVPCIIRQETVELTTLDIFFNNHPLTAPIKLIKIDVENNELNVLKGAVKTLEQNGYPKLVFEKHSDENENQKLVDFIRSNLGYHIQPISGYGHMYLASR